MLNTFKALALAGLTSVMMAGAGAAATVYDATSAKTGSNYHSFWFSANPFDMSGNSADDSKYWQFDTVGTFMTYSQGGMEFASLTGTIQQNGNTSNQMKVDAVFKKRAGKGAEVGGNKCRSFCNNRADWTYYDYDSVILSGIGDLAGLTLELSDKTGGNIPAQMGTGANDKDSGFGFSTWFNWEVTKADGLSGFTVGDTSGGDINIKLGNERDGQDPEPVPLPAGGVLLLTALGGLGLARRRKTRA